MKETLDRWLYGKDVLDILRIGGDELGLEEFIGLLKPLQHRAYSISSSPLAHPDRIHLTVASVRYQSIGRQRGGVCSTFLADRSGTAKIFLQPNKSFRVPADDSVPMIMVGPGTGIAPSAPSCRNANGAALPVTTGCSSAIGTASTTTSTPTNSPAGIPRVC